MGISRKDIRIFYNKRTKDYVIANDYKLRRLLNKGYSRERAEDESHGHVKKKKTAKTIKNNILANKKEKKRDLRTLGCYVRVADESYKHYKWICGLYETRKRKGKKQVFYRVNKGPIT